MGTSYRHIRPYGWDGSHGLKPIVILIIKLVLEYLKLSNFKEEILRF